MTSKEVLAELKKAGSDQVKKLFLKHGAKEPFYGVKVEDMKKIMKKIKDDKQEVAYELFDSGISDAQYLAALLADGSQMSKKELQQWAEKASWSQISEFAVPWVTSENKKDGFDLALKWIDSKKETIASSGWCSLSSIISVWPDEELDIKTLMKLLTRVEKEIHKSQNRVKYGMNGFVIAVGSFVEALSPQAFATAKKIGEVYVDMGETSCQVPYAPMYIQKVIDKGYLGRKKKMAKC
jgi:3-methyladenine DNA glycosylase AlkD